MAIMDCKRAKRTWKDIQVNIMIFTFQINTPVLADVLESFQNKCIETYNFISASRLGRQAILKKTKVELELRLTCY